MVNYAYLIPLFPLAAFAVTLFFGRRLKEKSAWISILGIACSFVLSCLVLKEASAGRVLERDFAWFSAGSYSFRAGFLVDPLSAMMLFVVTLVGMLVQVYSVGYMRGDKGYSRFFAYLSLFIFSMLGLVLANNLILVYIFWELVGVCSYLLISFWFHKPSAADAGKKAFIVNRVGDVGFFIGWVTLFYYLGTVNFSEISHKVGHYSGFGSAVLSLAAVLIFCGAVGKSAQFPLHVWLPDAMEGPTPVSALIHAATMVAAGVYLVARTYAVFVAGHFSLEVVTYIGIITAFMAGSIALVQNDIKRILAYSTVSQLGYMMLALGVGGYSAGVFHLMTHAFFKALLFLCAGSVIHGTGTQDIRQMGGLFRKMKVTAATCLIGALAISGVPPLSGFWSKDEILLAVYNSGNKTLYWLALLVAFMTAFYMFRLVFLTFFGSPRDKKVHAHESPQAMAWPLVILAVFSIFSGFLGSPFTGHYFSRFIYFHPEHVEANSLVMFSSIAVALSGIFLSWFFYVLSPGIPQALARGLKPVHSLLLNKYWIDEIYDKFLIRPFLGLTRLAFSFDSGVIDGLVNFSAALTAAISRMKGWVDSYIIDGLVNLTAMTVAGLGTAFRRLQTGLIQNYILLIFTGIVIFVFLLRFI